MGKRFKMLLYITNFTFSTGLRLIISVIDNSCSNSSNRPLIWTPYDEISRNSEIQEEASKTGTRTRMNKILSNREFI